LSSSPTVITPRAKNRIREIFPKTTLPMTGENRRFRFGQFGYGKYVYMPELMQEIRETLLGKTRESSPKCKSTTWSDHKCFYLPGR
jgi:spore photoproduct lyase